VVGQSVIEPRRKPAVNAGIIGSEPVAQALGRGFAELGDRVMIGSRTPGKLDSFVEEVGAGVSAGTFAAAARFGDLAVLATLWSRTEHALQLAGPEPRGQGCHRGHQPARLP
jgi:8-hydroxy-5-deazaflavin:NADPH oxidoreductase